MLDLLARHGRLDLDVRGDRRPGDRRATTPSRTSASASGRRSTQALGDRAGISRYGHATVPMDEARASCAIDISGPRRSAPARPSCRPGAIGGFDHELAEEFFRAVASNAKLTLHLTRRGRHERPPHDRGAFKAFARALRAAVAIDPTETRRAEHEGDADGMSAAPTIAIVDYGMGNRRSVEKAFEHVGAGPLLTRDHDEIRARRRHRRARRRRVPAGDAQPARARASTT